MKHWSRRGAVAWLLWPASLLFRLVVFLRKNLYRLRLLKSSHPGIPVIVVGNLTAGGTGKTPLVQWIAEFLRQKGRTPGIVSRGYGGSVDAPREASIASKATEVGDEPIVLARRGGCPVWVGADRARVIEALRAAHPDVDVLLLDDGLQHYALRRDLEIAVVDERGAGNGWMLPAGPLREPLSRLKSVDAIVSHGAHGVRGYAMVLAGDVMHRVTDAHDRQLVAALAGRKAHAVAGIGEPRRFFRHLERFGVEVIAHPFPDHHSFEARDLEFGDDLPVVMTEKDAVKLRHAARSNWWVLPVTAKLDPAFGEWLLGRLDEFRRRSEAA
ncbi:MAG: tetraacyldisaccharide 4'-kinase [Betaproteobacteria bacterium]